MNINDKKRLEEAYNTVNENLFKKAKGIGSNIKNAAADALSSAGEYSPAGTGAMAQIGSNVLKGQNLKGAIKSGVTQAAANDANKAAMISQQFAPQLTPALSNISQSLSQNDSGSLKKTLSAYINSADPESLKNLASMLTTQQ